MHVDSYLSRIGVLDLHAMMMERTDYSMRILLFSPSALHPHYMFSSLHLPGLMAKDRDEPVVMENWLSEDITYCNGEIHLQQCNNFCLIFFKSELF